MQTEKRAGRVMRNVAAVLVIILAIVALFQGFRMLLSLICDLLFLFA